MQPFDAFLSSQESRHCSCSRDVHLLDTSLAEPDPMPGVLSASNKLDSHLCQAKWT